MDTVERKMCKKAGKWAGVEVGRVGKKSEGLVVVDRMDKQVVGNTVCKGVEPAELVGLELVVVVAAAAVPVVQLDLEDVQSEAYVGRPK